MLQKGTKYQVPHFEDSRASKTWRFFPLLGMVLPCVLRLLSARLMEVSLSLPPHLPPSLKTKSLFNSSTTREAVCIEAKLARIFYFLPLLERPGSLQWQESSHLVTLRTSGWQD